MKSGMSALYWPSFPIKSIKCIPKHEHQPSSLQIARPRGEQAGRTPLQKKNDGGQHRDFAHHRSDPGLENLVSDPDTERSGDGAGEVADASQHHDHKAVHNVI